MRQGNKTNNLQACFLYQSAAQWGTTEEIKTVGKQTKAGHPDYKLVESSVVQYK